MKALIVDDEKHVCEAIRLLVDWSAFGIDTLLEAQDGEAGIRLIQEEKPELVFTDMMMPGINGVGLLEWIHANAPATKTIVISGHDDFEFVRNTVKYGGMDYLLKPIDPGELREAVAKAVDSRRQEDRARLADQRRNIEMNQLKPVYWDKMFSNLIADPSYYCAIRDNLEQEFGVDPDVSACRAAALSLETIPSGIRAKFASGMDLLIFSLLNICNELLGAGKNGFAFRYWHSESLLALLLWKETERAEQLIESINEAICRTLGGRFEFGLGLPKAFPAGIAASFQEAVKALRQRNLLVRGPWVHKPRTDVAKSMPHFTDYEESVRLAIRSGSEERIAAALKPWFGAVAELKSVTLEMLELWQHEANVLRMRWLKEMFGEAQPEALQTDTPTLAVPMNDDGTLSLERWRRQWTDHLLRLAAAYTQQRQEDRHVIHEIAKYIQNHYAEDIALQDIANRFFLSREYISRKFKLEFQENLSDYISRIRVEKAKLLLLHPHHRVSQVAEMVGYRDEKYFSKVFKKATGLSPNEYRKLNGQG